jgi:hypothetical protein
MDYSIDWLEQLNREAWAARIRQLRRELREERSNAQTRLAVPSQDLAPPSSSGQPTRPIRCTSNNERSE